MQTRLALAIVLAISALVSEQPTSQKSEWLTYYPTIKKVESFFQGQLSEHKTLAGYNVRYLHFMREKPLLDAVSPSVPQIFRLLVNSRPHSLPAIVRLSIRTDGSGEAVIKVSQSLRNSEALAVNRTEEISVKQVNQLLSLVASSDFWAAPAVPAFDINRLVPMGDADWMLEAGRSGAYHVVCRTTATFGSLRGPMMFLLIDIGKLDLASVEDDRTLSK